MLHPFQRRPFPGTGKAQYQDIQYKIKKPDYLAFLKIIPVIEEFKPHIVHTHNINASIDGIIASIIKKVPVKIHTDHARKFPDKTRYMIIEKVASFFYQQDNSGQ
jgi:hypothetical protein